MAFLDLFNHLMTEDVTVTGPPTYNQSGDPVQGASVTYKARIQGGTKTMMVSDGEGGGRLITSDARVYINTRDTIAPESRVTLPSTFVPNADLPILKVDRPQAFGPGADHVVLWV